MHVNNIYLQFCCICCIFLCAMLMSRTIAIHQKNASKYDRQGKEKHETPVNKMPWTKIKSLSRMEHLHCILIDFIIIDRMHCTDYLKLRSTYSCCTCAPECTTIRARADNKDLYFTPGLIDLALARKNGQQFSRLNAGKWISFIFHLTTIW